MFIKNITITNYRNFGDIPFSMDLKPFTIVIGENNIGKTNILNALGLIYSQEITVLKKRVLEIDDFNYQTIKAFKESVIDLALNKSKINLPVIRIETTLNDFTSEQVAIVGDWFTNKDLTEAKITYEYSPQPNFNFDSWLIAEREKKYTDWHNVDFPIDAYDYAIYGGNDNSNRCDSYFLRMLKMEFLDAMRDAKKELVASNDNRLLYKILSRKELSNYNTIKTILQDLEKELKGNNKNLLDIKLEVNKLLDKVSLSDQTILNEIDFEFVSPETSEILKKLSLIYGGDPISIDRNGLGRNNLLYISLLLSQIIEEEKLKSENQTSNFTAFRIIGIEEPESHLHPNLQTHLASNFESLCLEPGTTTASYKKHLQVITTSHSTHITSKVKLSNTVVLFKEPTGIKSHYILNGLSIKKDIKSVSYLKKYLDATKSTMFFSRKLILVEGISEQLLMPKFFEQVVGTTLEKANCSIINVNGVAFEHFLKIIKNGFFIKCVVFTDSDATKQTKHRAKTLQRAYLSHKKIIDVQLSALETFEKDLIDINKSGATKSELLVALEKTKKKLISKKATSTLKTTLGTNDINVNSFFSEIENYKSEFAFNLLEILNSNPSAISIPKYIQDGLTFLK